MKNNLHDEKKEPDFGYLNSYKKRFVKGDKCITTRKIIHNYFNNDNTPSGSKVTIISNKRYDYIIKVPDGRWEIVSQEDLAKLPKKNIFKKLFGFLELKKWFHK